MLPTAGPLDGVQQQPLALMTNPLLMSTVGGMGGGGMMSPAGSMSPPGSLDSSFNASGYGMAGVNPIGVMGITGILPTAAMPSAGVMTGSGNLLSMNSAALWGIFYNP